MSILALRRGVLACLLACVLGFGGVAVATPPPSAGHLIITDQPFDPAWNRVLEFFGSASLALEGRDPRTEPDLAEQIRSAGRVDVIGSDATAYLVEVVRSDLRTAAGGLTVFDDRTYLALYGHPSGPALGVLGEQAPKDSVKRVNQLVAKYRKAAPKRNFSPAFEIITTVATAAPGPHKDYSARTKISDLLPLVDAAEKKGITVILDLQPGRTDFLTQAKEYRELLLRPHVGLALDPEWRLGPNGKPLQRIGHVSAKEINKVSAWLAKLTRENRLPQKMFVLHQFQTQMIRDRSTVRVDHHELATVIHVDGQGSQPAKQGTWGVIRDGAPAGVAWGWKNFVDEDEPMLTTEQTWKQVRPHPELITYQ